jgi:cytochrome b
MSEFASVFEAGRVERPAEVRVWDLPVRIFHWSLVALFAAAWITADEWDRAHELIGYAVGGLILLRVVWGFIGTRHSRFSDFVRGPRTVLGYLGAMTHLGAPRHLGHNPAGGVMVIALLVSITAIVATGIMINSDTFWGAEWVEDAHEIFVNLTLLMILLHVAGVVFTSIEHGENLVRAMITGRKHRDP